MYTIEIKNILGVQKFEDFTKDEIDIIHENVYDCLYDSESAILIIDNSNKKTILSKKILKKSIITIYKQKDE